MSGVETSLKEGPSSITTWKDISPSSKIEDTAV